MPDRAKKFLRAALPGVVLAATPIAFSSEGGIVENRACAQTGTCCWEHGATCVIGDYVRQDAYYKTSGSCHRQT